MRRIATFAAAALLIFVSGFSYYAGTRHVIALPQTNAATAACVTFPETGKQLCDRFLEYWQANGGLAQQGLPLSDEFQEVSSVDGKTYTVQYFERAVFEKHPENQRPYDVLLSLLGREKYLAKYPGGLPTSGTPVAAGQSLVVAGSKPGVTFRVEIADVQTRTELPNPYGQAGTQKANGKFVIVLFRGTNLGQESSTINGYNIRARDSQGRIYDLADTSAHRGAEAVFGNQVYYETIQPGFSLNMVFVFDVAPDSSNLVFALR